MDDFMQLYESSKELIPQIRQQLNIKKSAGRNSIAFNKTNVRIKTLLNTFESDLKQLKNELQRLISTKRYPQIELDKRQELVNEINTYFHQFQQEFLQAASTSSQFQSNQNNYFDDDDNQNNRQYTSEEAKDRQMLLLQEQDQGMDMLGEILSKQKYLARDMCEEITIQNEIIDNINTALDSADQRLERNIRNTKKISRKSSTCGIY